LRNAGVIVVGKTNTPAFCSDFQSYNDLFGVTKNPWNVDRTPGGSSGGAAAALAARLTPIELGSDIAGSIRIPPAFCGVYGHKTTHAIVPMRGHIPPPPGSLSIPDLLVVGPMARCADDLALMLGLIAGPVPEDANAYALQLPPPRAATLRGYRVAAWLEDPAFPVDAEVAGRLQATVDALRRAGVTVDDAKPDFSLTDAHALYHRLFDPAMIAGSAKTIAQLEAARTVVTDPGFVTLVENSLSRHYEWLDANEKRAKFKAKLRQFFENYDVLLCPVAHVPAFPHDHSHPQFTRSLTVNGQKRPYLELMGWVSFATAVGAPATSAPIGRTKDGLPIGIQIVGSHFEDLTTIHFAGRLAELIGGFEPPPGF
jgi:amidase